MGGYPHNLQQAGAQLTRRSAVAGLAALAACAKADLVAGEEGRIARVSDGDLLALDTGLKVRLIEIEAPALGFQSREPEPFAEEARAVLVAAALGRTAKLHYGGLSRDKYERALAHVIASDETGTAVWLNGLMARQGAARVRTFPDNARRARRLLALETEARNAKRGLWALEEYRVRTCADIEGAPYFTLVEGPLAELREGQRDSAARIAADGFRIDVGRTLGKPDDELKLKPGARIRIRGRIDTRAEPQIRLTHWAMVEMA